MIIHYNNGKEEKLIKNVVHIEVVSENMPITALLDNDKELTISLNNIEAIVDDTIVVKEPTMADKIIADALREKQQQDEQWGVRNFSPLVWTNFIGESYASQSGEVAKLYISNATADKDAIYNETIKIMALCLAMLENMQEQEKKQ